MVDRAGHPRRGWVRANQARSFRAPQYGLHRRASNSASTIARAAPLTIKRGAGAGSDERGRAERERDGHVTMGSLQHGNPLKRVDEDHSRA